MHQNEHPDRAGLGNLLGLMTLSDGRLASEVGVSAATVRSWRTGRRSPSPENRLQLLAVARNHALTILNLIREMEGEEARNLVIGRSVTADLGELRRQIKRAGSDAVTIRRTLEETTRLLARRG